MKYYTDKDKALAALKEHGGAMYYAETTPLDPQEQGEEVWAIGTPAEVAKDTMDRPDTPLQETIGALVEMGLVLSQVEDIMGTWNGHDNGLTPNQ